jgi:hypothetical protein
MTRSASSSRSNMSVRMFPARAISWVVRPSMPRPSSTGPISSRSTRSKSMPLRGPNGLTMNASTVRRDCTPEMIAPEMTGIFVSYRREDTSAHAGRLADRLVDRFGETQVFMDVDSIGLGLDFVTVLQDAVTACEVMLVMIGPGWVGPRLEEAEDYVRIEVQTALDREIRVVPILVGGAKLPEAAALPEPLRPLARRQAFEIGDTTFRADASDLIERLERVLEPGAARTAAPAPAAGAESGGMLAALQPLGELAGVFLAPAIPVDRLAAASAAAAVPEDEEIGVLVNLSVFGLKDAVLFGHRGMYDRHSNHPGRTFSMSYEGIKAVGITVVTDSFFNKTIKVGDQELTLAGIKFDAAQLVNAVNKGLA